MKSRIPGRLTRRSQPTDGSWTRSSRPRRRPGLGGQIILPEGGTLRVEGDRADFYDARGNRTGYGVQWGVGSWDFLCTDGSRLGTLTPAIGGGSRLTISPPHRK